MKLIFYWLLLSVTALGLSLARSNEYLSIQGPDLQTVGQPVPIVVKKGFDEKSAKIIFSFAAYKWHAYDIWVWRQDSFNDGWVRRHSAITGENVIKHYYIRPSSREFGENNIVLVKVLLIRKP